MAHASQIELEMCLEALLREVRSGRMTGISYTAQTADGLVPGWSGEFSGRRLVVVSERKRIVAIDDPHAGAARRMGAER